MSTCRKVALIPTSGANDEFRHYLTKKVTFTIQAEKVPNRKGVERVTKMLGGETLKITYASKPPTVVLMAGLQGSGKTTNTAKLARWFKAQGRNPLMVGADLQRPAAVEQLHTLGRQIDVPVFSEPGDPVAALSATRRGLCRPLTVVNSPPAYTVPPLTARART